MNWLIRMGSFAEQSGEARAKLVREALARCWTPENMRLKDDAEFTRWFSLHPEDMMTLGSRAMVEVSRDFLSN